MEPEEKVKKIINILRKNSRTQLKNISQELGIPMSTASSKMKRAASYINKFTSLLDFRKIEHPIKMIIIGKIQEDNTYEESRERKDEEKIIKKISENISINNLYRISGKRRYMIEAYFKDMEELENFKGLMSKIIKIEKDSYIIIKEIEKENFLLP